MPPALRPISNWFSAVPTGPGHGYMRLFEPVNGNTPWLVLEQYASVPEKGRSLFSGTLAVRNARLREFRNYVRQGRAYWDAGSLVRGSSAALLYYYSFLNLAKAELLTQATNHVTGARLGHGLSFNPRGTETIGSDYLTVKPGVFPLLFEARTGQVLKTGTRLPVLSLLAQVHEVGLELDKLGLQRRPSNIPGLCVIARTTDESWLVLALTGEDMDLTGREPLARALRREFDSFAPRDLPDWRNVFAMSRRFLPGDLAILQSRKTFSRKDAAGIARPHYEATMEHLRSCLGSHVADSIDHQQDFLLTHSMRKSDSFTMPVPLARYALMFYLSSIVRYKPQALDPARQGGQAWLMDSFVREVPIHLLVAALTGVTRDSVVFEPNGFRV